MNIKFITFGSHDKYIKAAERLVEQAKQLNIFTETILYNTEYLEKEVEFWKNHEEFIKKNKRGYGYWIWKPYIIKKTMEYMNNGDILLYLDCGCELSCERKDNLLKYIDLVKIDKLIGSVAFIEKHWNKMDLIEKMNMNKNVYLNTLQRAAGANLFLVCHETINLVNEWYNLSCDYHNIDDSPSIIKNLTCFKQHRHDQSVFSLLTKKYNIYSKNDLKDAIYILRNKTGISRINN